jgi:hypothetical protein
VALAWWGVTAPPARVIKHFAFVEKETPPLPTSRANLISCGDDDHRRGSERDLPEHLKNLVLVFRIERRFRLVEEAAADASRLALA